MAVETLKNGYSSVYRVVFYKDGEIQDFDQRVYDDARQARAYGTRQVGWNTSLTFKVFRLDIDVYNQAVVPNSKTDALRELARSID